MKLTDMHCHIVYGVDDGAQTREQMQAMLLAARDNSIDHIVCTSHITPGEQRFPAEDYRAHLREGQQFCDENGLGIQLHMGSEILWTDMTPRMLNEGKVPTLDGGYTVLVEFWWDVEYSVMCRAARELGNEGMNVIFAHIERYKPMRNIHHIRELAEEYRVIMQMNCSTIIDKQGFMTDRWRNKVLEEGLVDLVATDTHNATSRPNRLLRCHEVLTERYGEDYADRLCAENQHKLFGWRG